MSDKMTAISVGAGFARTLIKAIVLVNPPRHRYSRRQKAGGRRQKVEVILARVSAINRVLIALATAILVIK